MSIFTLLIEVFKRLLNIKQEGEWKTVGPDVAEYPVVTAGDIAHVAEKVNAGEFTEGKWSLATYKEMHSGRIGRSIIPRTLVVHTTDMRPGTFAALVRNWTSQLGRGNGAHFLIGRTEADGIVQFAPIHRNANHAGGPNCGSIGGLHPNTISVGVELHANGLLKKVKGKWANSDNTETYPDSEVFVDEHGRGWHRITEYQRDMLKRLWEALKPTLKPWPAGTKVQPNAAYAPNGVRYAEAQSPALVGHVSMNVLNKRDPGPEVMALINSWI